MSLYVKSSNFFPLKPSSFNKLIIIWSTAPFSERNEAFERREDPSAGGARGRQRRVPAAPVPAFSRRREALRGAAGRAWGRPGTAGVRREGVRAARDRGPSGVRTARDCGPSGPAVPGYPLLQRERLRGALSLPPVSPPRVQLRARVSLAALRWGPHGEKPHTGNSHKQPFV